MYSPRRTDCMCAAAWSLPKDPRYAEGYPACLAKTAKLSALPPGYMIPVCKYLSTTLSPTPMTFVIPQLSHTRHQPFALPAVSPRIKDFCRKRKSTMIGIIESTTPAMIPT